MIKLRVATATWILLALLFSPTMQSAKAEDCPTYNFNQIFDEEFYPDLKWQLTNGKRVLNWSTNVTTVNKVPVARAFTSEEESWFLSALNAWDMTLDSISFQRVTDAASADFVIGLTELQDDGYWTVQRDPNNLNGRANGTIQISTTTPVKLGKVGFITTALSELGNLLGLGDIQHSGTPHSVMLDPDQPPFAVLPLEDFDIDLMRQFFGESTCHSAWSAELKQAKADYAAAKAKAEAEEKAAAEAAAAAKAAADAKAALDKAATEQKAREEALRAQLGASSKKVTITCIKGKLVKKVTAVNPKCPVGYKKK